MADGTVVIKRGSPESLRKHNYMGRARAYDNHAAKALAKILARKRATEAGLAEIGMKPIQSISKLVREAR